MCNITSVTNLNGKVILGCSTYEGKFEDANKLKILTRDQKVYETKNFVLDKARGCFSGNVSPWIMLGEDIPEMFLVVGNQIELQ